MIKNFIIRELLQHWRQLSDCCNTLLFFVMVASLFPLAMSSKLSVLQLMGPAVIWMAALLAVLLSLSHLFQQDYQDGSLEQLILLPYSLPLLLLYKVMINCMVFVFPLILVTPLLGLMYHLPIVTIGVLMLSLLLATPVLSLLGSIVAALTVGLRQNSILLNVLLLPLYVPVLIFGAMAALTVSAGGSALPELALLTAFLVVSLLLAPLATAFALRIGLHL